LWHWDPAFLDSFEPDLPAAQLRYIAGVKRITVPILLARGVLSNLSARRPGARVP
jgi:hypothetical protein